MFKASEVDINTHNFDAINNLVSEGGEGNVTGLFRDFTVGSAFQPIFSLSHQHPVGYEALCRAKDVNGVPVSPLALFGQVKDESDNVLLDRLCRTVHVQNFTRFSDKSWIFLNVNPLVTVRGKNYGSFFKEMLEHHNILPSQVVVEILEQGIKDESILSTALEYYKNLGCLIAIDDFGASHSNFDRIWNIQPDIVKFDRSIIVQAENNPVVRKALPSMVGLIQELGCIALMEGIETEQQALIAIDSNVDMVQGYYFGYLKRRSRIRQNKKICCQSYAINTSFFRIRQEHVTVRLWIRVWLNSRSFCVSSQQPMSNPVKNYWNCPA